jgi:hypothetical protein
MEGWKQDGVYEMELLEQQERQLAEHKAALADNCANCGQGEYGPRGHELTDDDWGEYQRKAGNDLERLIRETRDYMKRLGESSDTGPDTEPDPPSVG